MNRISITLFSITFLLSGCNKTPTVIGVDLGGPSAAITAIQSSDSNPAAKHAVYHAGKRFIIWGMGDSAGGSSSGGQHGVTGEGHVGKINFTYEILPKGQGTATIDGKSYRLNNGVIFLVSSSDGVTRVKQLDRDFENTSLDWESLRDFMKVDDEFKHFFAD